MLDRPMLAGFVASGAIWIAGIGLNTGIAPLLLLVAAVYVLIGSVALALTSDGTAMTLLVLWACAVGLMAAVILAHDRLSGIVIGAALLYGTSSFAVWMGAGFLLLHFFSDNKRASRS